MKAEHKLVILLIVLSLLLFCISLSAQQLGQYSEQIKMSKNGTAKVTWTFKADEKLSNEIRLPWNFPLSNVKSISPQLIAFYKTKLGKDSSVAIKQSGMVKPINHDGIYFIELKLDSLKNADIIKISFELNEFIKLNEKEEYGNYQIKYRYANTSIPAVNNYETTLYLPEGYVVVSIDETIPKQAEDNPVSPFNLGRRDELNTITVKSPKLKLGENVYLKITIREEKKSPLVLIVFGAIALLYLFYFRELTGDQNGNGNTNQTTN